MTNRDRLVEVFTSIDLIQVRIARDLLESAGINAVIFDEATLYPRTMIPARLMVSADCADEARDQLQELGFT